MNRCFIWGAGLTGFAAGGFFDGILLHQILQWHHLLSGVGNAALDLRMQIMADGIFHGLMYLVAMLGLLLAVRARKEFTAPAAAMVFSATFLIGFGAWHVVDAGLSHWVTGIHRVRMDTANPLFWDLMWLMLFGALPLAAGLLLRHRSRGMRSSALVAVPVAFLAATLVAGAVAARPVEGQTTTVVLAPGASPAPLLQALAGTDARIVWSDAAGSVWVLSSAEDVDPMALYRRGAMYVSGAALPAGCAAFVAGSPERS